jgi:hypothetical protein
MNTQLITDQVKQWVETVIIAFNFCPFAKRELDRDSIRYHVVEDNLSGEKAIESALHQLIEQCRLLDQNTEIETTLVIFPQSFALFDDFLDLLDIANALLEDQGYLGTYQLASFHPDYCFADAAPDDASNFTNRAPYPVLHLIREASIEQALKSVANPEQIPERNIALARELGEDKLRALVTACLMKQ